MNQQNDKKKLANSNTISDISKYSYLIVPMIIAFSLFQNYADLESIMAGETLKLYEYKSSIFVKALKDFSYIILSMVILLHSYRHKSNPFTFYFIFIFFLCLFLSFVSSQNHNVFTAILGFRWVTPLLLFMLMKHWSKSFNGKKAIPWVFIGMIGCLILQIYQLFFMPPIFGVIFGLSARTPGFFLAPNSAGFFGCACAVFIAVYSNNSVRYTLWSALIATAINALAQSGSGVLASIFLILQIIFARFQSMFLVLGISIAVLIYPMLDSILQRDGFSDLSGGGRIERLIEIWSESAFQINNFGYYTNAANLADELSQYRKAVDSLIASFIGNFGAVTLLVLITIGLFLVNHYKYVPLKYVSSPLLIFLIYAVSTIIFEAYPMNILLALTFWGARNIYLRERDLGKL